jgi:hypothetical protein
MWTDSAGRLGTKTITTAKIREKASRQRAAPCELEPLR